MRIEHRQGYDCSMTADRDDSRERTYVYASLYYSQINDPMRDRSHLESRGHDETHILDRYMMLYK